MANSKLSLATPKGYALRKDLTTLLEKLSSSLSDFQSLTTEKLEAISTEYEEKSLMLAELQKQIEETERVEKLDLDLRIKASKEDAFKELANELDYAVISMSELTKLQIEFSDLENSMDSKIQQVKEEQENVYKNTVTNIISELEAKAKVENANLVAQNTTLVEKVQWLTDQMAELRVALKTAQENSVKIAEAGARNITIKGD